MFQVYRRHRLGLPQPNMQDALEGIEHQRHGDVKHCDYDIKAEESGYQVYRTHRVGEPVADYDDAVGVGVGGVISDAAKFMRGDWFVRIEGEG